MATSDVQIEFCYLLSLAIRPYQPLILVSLRDGTQDPNRANEYKILLVGQHWCVHVLESIGEHRLWARTYFSSIKHVLLVLLQWFVR